MWVISKVQVDGQDRAVQFLWRKFTPHGQPVGEQSVASRLDVVDAVVRGDIVTTVWPADFGAITAGPKVRVRADEHGVEWLVLDSVPGDERRIEELPKL
ncbi:hypothetical protein [Roseateles chitosanitabidus]|uniref:hypothetical protein n=1 Tax=Roseateles chitosanitabidus TaxID=65048 RepID=UPI0011DF0B77|nr:hypothetical protein [Roseateles chitosanitabidus]